jgi:prepilin-type N-terminal cleavage/methylation domain-containing protein
MGRDGLTLIEVIVAMLVLTVGLLGLAAGTGYAIRNVELARVETNRAAAKQSAVETLQATPFDDVMAGSETIGAYQVTWSQLSSDSNWRLMEIVVEGPGRAAGGTVRGMVSDTIQYRLVAR